MSFTTLAKLFIRLYVKLKKFEKFEPSSKAVNIGCDNFVSLIFSNVFQFVKRFSRSWKNSS